MTGRIQAKIEEMESDGVVEEARAREMTKTEKMMAIGKMVMVVGVTEAKVEGTRKVIEMIGEKMKMMGRTAVVVTEAKVEGTRKGMIEEKMIGRTAVIGMMTKVVVVTGVETEATRKVTEMTEGKMKMMGGTAVIGMMAKVVVMTEAKVEGTRKVIEMTEGKMKMMEIDAEEATKEVVTTEDDTMTKMKIGGTEGETKNGTATTVIDEVGEETEDGTGMTTRMTVPGINFSNLLTLFLCSLRAQ
jgi:hypothetical protein